MNKNIGRFIYISFFKIQKIFVELMTERHFEAWYRNSLLQDYFSFGKSDIDVTVFLKSDSQLLQKSKSIASSFSLCPLIKEINFYYPQSLKFIPKVSNIFELSRDKKLSERISAFEGNKEAQAFVYLWHMYFSNLNKKELSKRDLLKWNFHFTHTGNTDLTVELIKAPTKKNLLLIIFKKFDLLECIPAATYAIESFLAKKPLFDQFKDCPDKAFLFFLLPQQFCFIEDPSFDFNDVFKEKILIEQFAWEIAGMMNQPVLFYNDGPGFSHLKNILKTLEKLKFATDELEKRRIELKMITDSYQIFLFQDHP